MEIEIMDKIDCECGGGWASHYDKMCAFCRENSCGVRRAVLRDYVKHRGDGLPLDEYFRMMKKL